MVVQGNEAGNIYRHDQIVLANGTSPKTVDYFIEKSESFTTPFEEFFELQSLATSYKGVTYYDN
mgnify:CR=1 FL=1